jgi:carbonic anhydrase
MDALDLEDRWMYKGSYTEPPCTGGVYWNVLRTIYPINAEMLDSIKHKMTKLSSEVDDTIKYDKSKFG